jgi:hypothetical protein
MSASEILSVFEREKQTIYTMQINPRSHLIKLLHQVCDENKIIDGNYYNNAI